MAEEIIRFKGQYYIRATSPLADDRTRVLKQGETFAVFDRYGDIGPVGADSQGLYHEGTRFLSRLLLRLEGARPLLLSSTVKEDNALLAVDLTNPDLSRDGEVAVPRGTLHLLRTKFLWGGVCYEAVRVRNFGPFPVRFTLGYEFGADFADLFEVRGVRRPRRGRVLEPRLEGGEVHLAYEGLDGVPRRTRLVCPLPPAEASPSSLSFELSLSPRGEAIVYLAVACEVGEARAEVLPYEEALARWERAGREARSRYCHIYTSNEQFNDWVNRSRTDIQMMVTDTAWGPYPYAGVPWFCTPFGRDGIITALETLWVNPDIARGVLAFLSAYQAQEVDPSREAEPGKILHETRRGEMATLGEVPFGLYYGSADSTPLFVLLAGLYYECTGDLEFIRSLWPAVERALHWIDRYGDADGDGFVEYRPSASGGLVNQGWRDSDEAVFHADGSLARGPIALCEVQGYVYAAKVRAAEMALALGQEGRARELWHQAHELQRRFDRAFWCDDLGTYALALDGEKRPCRVRTSNAGHCLFSGVAMPERARRLAETLLSPEGFSGWGVRTVFAGEARYNPMSYHNGSVWPHDTAIIAYGLARYGMKGLAERLLTGLFDASLFLDLHRMPELFCGFPRRPGEGPTLYPVACLPQAWSAGAVYLLLQAVLGLTVHGVEGRAHFYYPLLPQSLQRVQIQGLRVGRGVVDLTLQRHGDDVSVTVQRKEGPVEVVVVK